VAALEGLGPCTAVACGHLHSALLLSPTTSQTVPRSPIAAAAEDCPAATTRRAVAGAEGGEGGGEGGEGGEGGGEGGEGGGEEAAPLLYGFGHAEFAQLGTGDMGSGGEAARAFALPHHVPLQAARGRRLRAVACGALHTCVLCDDGTTRFAPRICTPHLHPASAPGCTPLIQSHTPRHATLRQVRC